MQKKILYSLAVLFISASVMAQPSLMQAGHSSPAEMPFAVAVNPDSEGTAFTLHVQNSESKKIGLQIVHPVLGLLVDTSFSSTIYKCRYNFERVEDGRYQLIITCGKERYIRDFGIHTTTSRNLQLF